MKHKKYMSILLALIMLFSTIGPTGLVAFAQEEDTTPPKLKLEQLTPENGGNLKGTDGEISLTFNQPVEIDDEVTPQTLIYYDKKADGKPVDMIDALWDAKVMQVAPDNPNKILINIKDHLEGLSNKGINHVYSMLVNENLIRSVATGDTYKGILNETDWIFDTHTDDPTLIEITGDTTVEVDGSITLTANVRDFQGNVLPEQEIKWDTGDAKIATVAVDPQSPHIAEITGVFPGKTMITASLGADGKINTRVEVNVGDFLDYGLIVKQAMQLSSKKGVRIRGVNMHEGVVHALLQEDQNNTILYAFDLYGHQLWKTSLELGAGTNWSSVPVYDERGNVYVQYTKSDGKASVYAIGKDGKVNWKTDTDKENPLSVTSDLEPVIIGDQLILSARNGIYSLDIEEGHTRWEQAINGEGLSNKGTNHSIESSPKVNGNTVYIDIQPRNTAIKDGKIQAYDLSGKEVWHYISEEGVLNPLIGNEAIYVVDRKGKIVALDTKEGTEITDNPLSKYDIGNVYRCRDAAIGVDNTIYISCTIEEYKVDGKIVAISSDGKQKYSYSISAGLHAVDDAGYLYYTKANSEGRSTIYALDPYGKVADTIPGYDSTVAGYLNLKAPGSILLGSRTIYGQFIMAKIQRNAREIPASIEFVQTDKSVGVNIQDTLPVVVRNTEGKPMIADELVWSSSNESILSVVDGTKGIFKGLEVGEAQVTVQVKNYPEVTKTLTVKVEEKQPVPTSVEILSKDGEVIIDDPYDIEYQVPYTFSYRIKDQYNKPMEGKTGFWQTSLNLNNVTVDEKGQFHPRAVGDFPLSIVSDEDNTVRKDITVKIKKEASSYGGILPKEAVLTLPGEIQLRPSNQYGEPFALEGITWTSKDPAIAEVDENGKVTATAYGTTTVTGAKGNEEFTKEIHVVKPFGYEWNKEHNEVVGNSFSGGTSFAEDLDGNIYYKITSSDNNSQLISIKPDGSENWNVNLGQKRIRHIQWVKDSLYSINYSTDGKWHLTKVNPGSGEAIWEFDLGSHSSVVYDIQEGTNGNVYVASGNTANVSINTFYAVDKDKGTEQWNRVIDGIMHNYTVDDAGMIYMPIEMKGSTTKFANSQLLKVQDEGDKATVLEDYSLEGIPINILNSNIIIDQAGTLYAYFHGTVNDILARGVLAIEEGQLKWVHYFGAPYDRTSDVMKLVFGKDGEIYFTSFDSNTSRRIGKIGALDRDGNLLFEKELTDLVESGKLMYASGDFEIDDSGNIYMPMVVSAGSSREASIVVQLSPRGTVMKYVSYPVNQYGSFDYIHLSDKGIYIAGRDGNHLIKFSHENTQEQIPSAIRLNVAKSSMTVGDYLDVRATVTSQVGIAMADEKVTWFSSAADVATVDDEGRVTAHKPGKTVITATSVTDSDLQATHELTIVDANAHYVTKDKLDGHVAKIINNYKMKGIDGDWAAFAIHALGEDINSPAYATNNKTYIGKLLDMISASESLGAMTEYERMTLAILAGGYDPHNFGGMNLIEKIANYSDLSQGNNAVIWGLLAFDAADAKIPEGSKYSSKFFVDYLLDRHVGQGWALSGSGSDVDITAMAIYALAPYYNGWETYKQAEVKKAVDQAVEWLKTKQQEVGGFNYTGENLVNTESTAQVIMALTSIGIDPQSSAFTRGQGNPVSALLSNQMADGTFMHKATINQSDHMATSQGLQGLAALKRFSEKGHSDIFYHIAPKEPVQVEDWMELISDINQLPEDAQDVTLKHKELIEELRSRYEALSKDDKEKVTNADRFLQAEKQLARFEVVEVGSDGKFEFDSESQSDTSKPVVLDFGKTGEQELPQVTAKRRDIELEIPANTKVTSQGWDGLIQVPTIRETSEATKAIINAKLELEDKKIDEIGLHIVVGGDKEIVFDQHVTLTLKGQAGKDAGFIVGDGIFEIIKKYADANSRTDDVYAYDSGDDLVIKTKHFTEFLAYKAKALSDTGGGGTAPGPTTKQATLSVEKRSINKGDIIPPTQVTLEDGDTAFTLLQRVAREKGINIAFTGSGATLYVQAIDGLREFGEGPESGWMYSVNGIFPEYSAGSYTLKDGDTLRWQYTTNLGKDIGGYIPDGGGTAPEPTPETEDVEVNPNKPFILDEALQKNPSTFVTLNFGVGNKVLPQVTAPRGDVVLEIAQGTKVTSDWDGKLLVPTNQPTSTKDLAAINGVLNKLGKEIPKVDVRIKVGGDKTIMFDRHVTLTFKGKAGLEAGLIDTDGKFEVIGTDPTADVYYYVSGNHLIIKTKHFTEFLLFASVDKTIDFSDVKGHWAEEFIREAARLGIIKGHVDRTFKPDKHLTRAQAVSILVRALDLQTDEAAPFKDIKGYLAETQAEIAAAYKYGLVIGQDGNFMPSKKVSRSQIALMLHRAYEQKTGVNYIAKEIAPYPDLGHYDEETINAISMLYEMGIATGSDGKYMPANPTQRAHAAKMLVNFFEQLQ